MYWPIAMRFAVLSMALALSAGARPFTVVVYNVENLFDADDVSAYEDYQATLYRPSHFSTKLANIAEVLTRFNEGAGPEVILFQEIEVDQTPAPETLSAQAFLQQYRQTSTTELLARSPLPAALATLPAEIWLLKALADRGLTGYTVVSGSDYGFHEGGSAKAVKCVTFTRFPVRAVRQHPVQDARNILETELDVAGARLFVFNNHWKSGASDPLFEEVRRQNAAVLRKRLDAIQAEDAKADIVIGGDFNSQYNQRLRHPEMKRTAVNDVLRSQGNELAIRGSQRDLYNLWFELPPAERGSDTYRGEWGTLMQLILSRGLYDQRGVQYVDNSFGVARFPRLNADAAGAPIRWQTDGARGSGFSDHLPIYARFQTVADERPNKWISLQRPADGESRREARRVDYSNVDLSAVAVTPAAVPVGADLRDGSWTGKIFRVEGTVVPDRHPRVRYRELEYEVYGVDDATRARLHEQKERGHLAFYGELGTFKGRWQFVVKDPSWVR